MLYQGPDYLRTNEDEKYRSYRTFTKISGTFYERLWLRFGNDVHKIGIFKENPDNPGWGIIYGNIYTVQPTSNISAADSIYSMPSSIVQSDSFEVSNAVHDALSGYESAPVGVKLQQLYLWLLHNTHYDFVSLDNSKRKPQDAVSTLTNRMAVCEGLANTYAAMARYCGIPTQVIGSDKMNHAWNVILYDNEWKLLDNTWDNGCYDPDQSDGNIDKHPYDESYTYFLIDLNGAKHLNENNEEYYDHEDPQKYIMNRSVSSEELIPPYNRDMPDGWY